ncbi:GGDEF domain-containing protein [Phenylobacterium immobile]|uniref:GGDEF domain-containing protein n=1 Tax=Phenylobacterium immobile TaxID=21 RepID=UPI000ACEF807|nr:GGDEF domain-containing protein [Phenylobacterium immobile]
MEAGVFGLMANTGIAALFAAAFAAIALTDSSQVHARRFGAAYAVGLLTPLSEILVRYSSSPAAFSFLGYVAFLAAQLMTAHCVSQFFGQTSRKRLLIVIFAVGVGLRLAIWSGPRDWLPYEIAYQAPFALAMLLAALFAAHARPRRWLTVALAADFALIAAHYPVKAVVSTIIRSGATAQAYASSAYAVFSQAATGMLLTSAGLILLLLVFDESMTRSRREAHHDFLTGLLNRRGFFHRMGEQTEAQLQVIVFDIDRFKSINDLYGHAVGDAVIVNFADLLSDHAPSGAVVARMGGEEFVITAAGLSAEAALRLAEQVRSNAETSEVAGRRFTVSAGLATRHERTSLDVALRRADQALYAAKQSGRNRVHQSEDAAAPSGVLMTPDDDARRNGGQI